VFQAVKPAVEIYLVIDDAIADPDRLGTMPLERLGADADISRGLVEAQPARRDARRERHRALPVTGGLSIRNTPQVADFLALRVADRK
jgi:hypothetical protein